MDQNNDIVEAHFTSKAITTHANQSDSPVLKIKCKSEMEMTIYKGASYNLTMSIVKVMMNNAY